MTEAILVDTDVFSFLLRGDPPAARFEPLLAGRVPAVSFATVAELRYGALKRGWGERKCRHLEEALRRYLFLPANPDVSAAWARVRSTMDAAGHGMAGQDRWIAATALAFGCALLTNNNRHFERVPDLKVNPGPFVKDPTTGP